MDDLKPLFSRWISQWADEASNPNTRRVYTNALKGLGEHRQPILKPSDAPKAKFIGPGITKKLTDRYEKYQRGEDDDAPAPKAGRGKGKSAATGAVPHMSIGRFDTDLSALAGNPFVAAPQAIARASSSRAPPPAEAPKRRGRPPKRPSPADEEDLPAPKRFNAGFAGLDDPQAFAMPVGDLFGGLGGGNAGPSAAPAPAFPGFWYLGWANERVRTCDDARTVLKAPFLLYAVEVLSSSALPEEFRHHEFANVEQLQRQGSQMKWLDVTVIHDLNLYECAGFVDPSATKAGTRAPVASSSSVRPAPPKDDLASLLAQEKRSKVKTLDPTRTLKSRIDASVPQDAAPAPLRRTSTNQPSSSLSSEPDFENDPAAARRAAAEAALRRQQQQQPNANSSDPKGKAQADRPTSFVPVEVPKPARTVSMPMPSSTAQASTSRSTAIPAPMPARTFSAPTGPSRPLADVVPAHAAATRPSSLSTSHEARPQGTFEPFVPQVIPAGTYDVVLILDNREARSAHDRALIQRDLVEKGARVEQRPLAVGDVLWIAKVRDSPTEVVLNWVLERKRLDDLCASIKSGHFHEQKFRLRRSALSHPMYLVEAWKEETYRREYELQINTALSSTQIIDNFIVKETRSLQDTVSFLQVMHETIKDAMNNQSLHVIPSRHISRPTYLDLQAHLRKTKPQIDHLTSYDDFTVLNRKNATHTVEEAWARMLLCVKLCSAERTAFILEYFPTPYAMWEACKQAQERENAARQMLLLESQSQSQESSQESSRKGKAKKVKIPLAKHFLSELGGGHRRKVGDALSERIWDIMMGEYPYS